jgi:dTDP-4-amino-4,6-dideoxygalactose transaminase
MNTDWPSNFPGCNWLDRTEERAALDVLRSGALFRYYGPKPPTRALALEARARSFYGVRHALAVGSCTGGLMTAMTALGIGPGDEVIVPSFFWVSTAGSVVCANAIPVLCEVDDTFTMDPKDLERKITSRTRLILVVHMAGAPADMRRIMAIARRRQVAVLEDCAQCNGGSFRGRKVGTFGVAGVFSFQINKNATSGEGGVIVTNDAALADRLNAAHDVGVPWVGAGTRESLGVWTWGQGRRMSELCAAVADVQLGKLPRIVAHMSGSHRRIRERLAGTPGLALRRLTDPAGDTGAFLIVTLPTAETALVTVEKLKTAGLRSFWRIADYFMHVYSNVPQLVNRVPLSPAGNPWRLPQNRGLTRNYARGACPQSDDLFARSLIITVPSRLNRAQERWMADTIRAAVSA